jgi:hypothetical protein
MMDTNQLTDVFFQMEKVTDDKLDSELINLTTKELVFGLNCYISVRVRNHVYFELTKRWQTFSQDNMSTLPFESLIYMLSLSNYNHSHPTEAEKPELENTLAALITWYFMYNHEARADQFQEALSHLRSQLVNVCEFITMYDIPLIQTSSQANKQLFDTVANVLWANQKSHLTQKNRFS